MKSPTLLRHTHLEVDYIQLDRSQCLGGGSGTPVRVMLQASNEQFLVVENNGGGAVHANRRRAGPWERSVWSVDANGSRLGPEPPAFDADSTEQVDYQSRLGRVLLCLLANWVPDVETAVSAGRLKWRADSLQAY